MASIDHSEFICYSDESGLGERFTSIATVSFKKQFLEEINEMLFGLLKTSNVDEFKWQKLKDAKYRFCAEKLIDAVFPMISKADMRIDVLIWDNEDSRHAVKGRNDSANFERMYFHLHSRVMRRRPIKAIWSVYPDEKLGINWKAVEDCLSAVGRRIVYADYPLLERFFADPHYRISKFKQIQSHFEPCCQIADLFAGLAVFSKVKFNEYELWRTNLVPHLGLWNDSGTKESNRDQARFLILNHFDNNCKKRKLGVSLKSGKCLRTPNPNNPINFWHYEPQHENDKAPV